MRKLLITALMAVSVIAGPAVADPAPPVSEPCSPEQYTAADFLVRPGELQATIPTPLMPSIYPLGLSSDEPDPLDFKGRATDVHTVIVDVSPDHRAATVGVNLAWEHAGDIDMVLVKDGEEIATSTEINPVSVNAEAADAGEIGHCQTFEVHVRNFVSTQGDIAMGITTQAVPLDE